MIRAESGSHRSIPICTGHIIHRWNYGSIKLNNIKNLTPWIQYISLLPYCIQVAINNNVQFCTFAHCLTPQQVSFICFTHLQYGCVLKFPLSKENTWNWRGFSDEIYVFKGRFQMSLLIKWSSPLLIVLYNLLALHQNVFQMTTHFVLSGLLCLLPVDPAEHWENTRTTGKIQQQIYLFLPNFTMLMLTSNKPRDFNFHPIQTWHCPFDLALICNVIPSCKATFKTT